MQYNSKSELSCIGDAAEEPQANGAARIEVGAGSQQAMPNGARVAPASLARERDMRGATDAVGLSMSAIYRVAAL
jgi:hypothetical protein